MTRHWPLVLAAWAAALVAMLLTAPPTSAVRSEDDSAFLPDSTPSRQACQVIQSHFDKPAPMSVAAVVIERPTGLTGSPPTDNGAVDPNSDWGYIARLTDKLEAQSGASRWTLLSPGNPNQAFLRGVMVSPNGQAATIKVDLPTGFASRETFADVNWIERAAAAAAAPAGLNVVVTGSATYGRDSNIAAETSLKRTTWACILAVVLILLIAYRALAAAAVSLLTVTVAMVVSVSIVAIGGAHGWSVSVLVEIFTIVVGYGAGVDFSLFFLSRYHEELALPGATASRADRRAALGRALRGTGPAIVASAGTVAAGLSLMYFSQFRVFHTAGPAVAISIVIACIASLTLAPALAYLIGPRIFWPRRAKTLRAADDSSNGPWDRVAALVAKRELPILLLGLVTLIPLAAAGWSQEKVYDTLADLPSSDPSIRGARIFTRYFPQGEMAPVEVMVRMDRPLTETQWTAIALAVDRKLATLPEVHRFRSLAHPLGLAGPELTPPAVSLLMATSAPAAPSQNQGAALLSGVRTLLGLGQGPSQLKEAQTKFRQEVLPRYLGRAQTAARWEVVLPSGPYSNQSLDSMAPLATAMRNAAKEAAGGQTPQILMAGDTAMMRDLREVTDRDFWLVAPLAVVTIILIVTLLIRDLPTALFVMLATILTYGSALALTAWIFHFLFATQGLDWKVNYSLFVILVAVGQDYNLFMLTRIMEGRRAHPLRPAVQSAVARTGSIISFCGLIMAATLGSLASSPLRLLQELGIAFIIGLLIDTFVVRPLMVPAFILVFRRMNRSGLLRPWGSNPG